MSLPGLSGDQGDPMSRWIPSRERDGGNSVFALRLSGELDVGAMETALGVAMTRLRGDCDFCRDTSMQFTDLTAMGEGKEDVMRRAVAQLAVGAGDGGAVAGGPRAVLFRLAPHDWTLAVAASPAHANDVSWTPFAEDLSSAYASRPLAKPPWRAVYNGRQPSAVEFWTRVIADAPRGVVLPTASSARARSFEAGAVPIGLTPVEQEAARILAARASASPPVVLVAAFAALLMRYAGEPDLLLEWSTYGPPWLLPLRLKADLTWTFTRHVAATKEAMDASLAHAGGLSTDHPIDGVNEAQSDRWPPDETIIRPSVGVSIGPRALGGVRLPGVVARELMAVESVSRRHLDLRISVEGTDIAWALTFNEAALAPSTVRRVAAHLHVLLTSALATPGAPLSLLPILPREEHEAALTAGTGTRLSYPDEPLLPDLFEERARAQPDSLAVAAGSRQLTYAQLATRADALAYRLLRIGVGPEDRVGAFVGRDPDAVTAFLGILKAGAAYVPLDDQYPADRLDFIARDAGLRVIVIDRTSAEEVPVAPGIAVISLRDRDAIAMEASAPIRRQISPAGLAYVIYTSGSTGEPKGVCVTHGGLANLALSLRHDFAVTPADRVALFASFGFDASIWEMVMALSAGAALIVLSPRMETPDTIAAQMTEAGVTCATLPPSYLSVLTGRELPRVRLLVSAGEACPAKLSRTWASGRRFVNAYGPTETTVCATMRTCTGREPAVPIGRPLANVDAYVLDSQLEPVPLEIPGELYVAGDSLARGYHARPGMTAAAFIPDPFGPPGSRLYRTGDVVRRNTDGELVYVGRGDEQVKVRGHRVELGEVAAAVARHPDVRDVVVLAEESGDDGADLVAFVVLVPDALPVARRGMGQQRWQGQSLQHELSGFLAAALPAYMLPRRYVVLPAFPVTAHGKVDHDALRFASPAEELADVEPTPAEMTEAESDMAALWARHLGLERVRLDDHFLEIGGHSLVAVQMITEIRGKYDVNVPIRVLFENPVLYEFVAAVQALVSEGQGRAGLES